MTQAAEAIGFDFAAQLRLLAYAVIIGAALGVLFDVLRISRVFLATENSGGFLKKASDAVLFAVSFIEDTAFFIISALTIVLFVFQANQGSSRGFILMGALGGFFLYLATVGRLTMLAANAICRFLRWIASLLYKKILLPILRLGGRVAGWIYEKTLRRVLRQLLRAHRRSFTKRTARELARFCAMTGYQRKGSIDESGKIVHTGKARDFSRVSVYDNNTRERADSIQYTRGEARKAPGTDRRRSSRHRRAEQ